MGTPRFAPRRVTEIAVGLVAAMLVAGVLIGISLSARATGPAISNDGLAWIPDTQRGEAFQINPGTGRAENRLSVADPGQDWQLAQRDGLLVISTADGAVTVVDVATLTANGTYDGGPAMKVLLGATTLFVVDRAAGTITRLDPGTAAETGTWTAGSPLADAATDEGGTVHALTVAGQLHRLEWTDAAPTATAPPVAVPGGGPRAVLVPNDRGVTILGLRNATVMRVGTAADGTLPAPQVEIPLRPAARAPADLVPAAVTGLPRIILVTAASVLDIDTTPLDCALPGEPAVQGDHVYVPCGGTGRVLVLDRAGGRARSDLTLGGAGTPVLTVYNGLLYATMPGVTTGLIVAADGRVSTLVSHDPLATPVPLVTPSTKRSRPPSSIGPSVTPSVVALPPAGVGVISYVQEDGPYQSSSYPCGGMDYCYLVEYYYTVLLSPPPAWRDFPGSCAVRMVRSIDGYTLDIPLSSCAQSDVYLGYGDGYEHTFTVRACAGSCVESGGVPAYLQAPYEYNCGSYTCLQF